jgi:hypothetical protein
MTVLPQDVTLDGLRAALERSARRFHDLQQTMQAREHKFWKFEHCPAPACAEARRALDITEPRAPGAEG